MVVPSDRWAWSTAAGAATGALVGRYCALANAALGVGVVPRVALGVGIGTLLSGLITRRFWLCSAAVFGLAVSHAAISTSTLHVLSSPRRVTEAAVVAVADAEPSRFETRVLVEFDHRRYQLELPSGILDRNDESIEPPMAEGIAVGDRLVVSGTARALQPLPTWLEHRHVTGTISGARVAAWRPATAPASMANRLRAMLPEADGDVRRALLRAMVIGDDRGVPSDTEKRFKDAGLLHLMVVSGQNLSLVVAAFAPMIRSVVIRRRWLLLLGVIVGFVAVVRPEPSVIRAAGTAGLLAVALAVGRRPRATRALALVLSLSLVIDPLLVVSVGLWLSVAATLGLLHLAPLIDRWMREHLGASGHVTPTLARLFGAVIAGLAATTAAQFAVAPILWMLDSTVPLSALVTNLAVAPIVFVLSVVSGVGVGLALLGLGPAADVAFAVAISGAGWVDAIARWGADHPGAQLTPRWWGVVVVAVAFRWGWTRRIVSSP